MGECQWQWINETQQTSFRMISSNIKPFTQYNMTMNDVLRYFSKMFCFKLTKCSYMVLNLSLNSSLEQTLCRAMEE